ncbi:Bye1p [Nakaseomyces bracarensis]|uniref:Bye1p n=1 Tax=Nakaseomyces bracarensis TaxID=273131 RepID=UPI003871D977
MSMQRKSSRATKGRNNYLEELRKQEEEEYQRSLEKAEEKEKGKRHKKEVVKEVVHCSVCKTTDSNYDEETDPYGEMIQCDECDTWQHINCMLQHYEIQVPKKLAKSQNIDELTKLLLDGNGKYICDRCKYKAQVREERKAFREQIKREQELRLKEEEEAEAETEEQTNEPLDDDNDEEFIIPEDTGNVLDDDFIVDDDKSVKPKGIKKRKTSTPTATTTTAKKPKKKDLKKQEVTPPPKPVDPYLKIRNNARNMVCNLFKNYIIPDTIKQNVYTLPENTTFDDIAESFSTKLEDCLFEHCKRNSNYKTLVPIYSEKVRVLFSNLKDSKNLELKKGVINSTLPLEDLVAMSATELANPDLQSFKQKIDSQKIDSLIIPNQINPNEDESNSIDEHHTQYDFSNKTFQKTNDEDPNGSSSKENSLELKEETNSESSISAATNDIDSNGDILNVKFKFDYSEVDMKVVGSLQFLGSTFLDETKCKKTSLNAVGDGNFVYEGRLHSKIATDYINEIKTTRAILLYKILPPSSQSDKYNQLVEFMNDLDRVLGLQTKRIYEKNVYLTTSTEKIPPCIDILNKDDDVPELNIDFSRFKDDEKYLYLLIVVKPELL